MSAWDRPSQLMLEGLLVVVMLASVALTTVTLIGLLTGREFSVPVDLTEQSLGSAPGASLVMTQGELTLTHSGTSQILLAAAPAVLGCAVVVGATYSFLQVVRSLRSGTPFHRRNARRLVRAALIVLVGGAAAALLDGISSMALAAHGQDLLGESNPIVPSATFPLTFLGIGLLLFCLAEFFRRGTELSDDLEGLV